ncbi:hypothetical protein EJ04DRAFT_543466 [Polyplosphaeria fusca]|uniref:UBA domain-containing protein n=1 Tax=Polyplosphaeria fusca TaxID=682080 RepID=A0A9P4V1K3_9PLEO|nr:hypothetical protein EJ04DRAFT_543466 [Polyplosphaeria fusca]
MDDLAGLDWSAPSKPTPTLTPTPSLPPFRQSPIPQLSGRSTPLSAQQSGSSSFAASNNQPRAPSKPATPANDSFSGLVSLNSSKASTNKLSLQERQKQIQEEKLRQEAERKKQYDSHFAGADSRYWDSLGSGKSTPEPALAGVQRPTANLSGGQSLSKTINKPFAGIDTSSRSTPSQPADDDLLSAFSSTAPVDASSHFPPPSSLASGRSTPAYSAQGSTRHTPAPQTASNAFDDDDDMFGLHKLAPKPSPSAQDVSGDDDILGLLGKPVTEFEESRQRQVIQEPEEEPEQRPSQPSNPQDKAVAELVDMGFPADKSAIALASSSESGTNVQAAVSWLLNQAHSEAKQKTSQRNGSRPGRSPDEFAERPRRGDSRADTRDSSTGGSVPAWMRGEEGWSRSGQRRQDGTSGAQDKDVSQYATDIGSTLFKSANSLWKTGQKKVQKAVADFQQDGDPNVPKWMRNTQSPSGLGDEDRKARQAAAAAATDEAMMLESGGRPAKPPRSSENRHHQEPPVIRQRREQEQGRNGLPDRMASQSPSFRQPAQFSDKRPAAKLTRQDIDEQSAQAYVSPARRKKPAPQPTQPDLFSAAQSAPSPPSSRRQTPAQSNNPFLQASTATSAKSKSPAATPPPPRPKAPPRQIPPASSSALTTSAAHRQKGSEAFKRGDYSAAHTSYSAALSPLPQSHPVTIILLCNRAVTNIKVGDPKAAVADADAALAIIGISRGEGEKIAMGGGEGDKDMKDFFGRALMRKAEALEHMEKWADAGKVWKDAVEAGVGGSISIQGRNRCDKAAGGATKPATPAPAKRPPVRKPPPARPSALSELGGASGAESDAVKKLRLANAAADKADDEKFALTDQVDAKLVSWKGTKADNLRALLGSLDKVLWPEAGWNKVNMSDLVMPNKVKIIYMKAIAKVHPDKISQTATTEQRMISAAVFATLNEAWDKFKTDNGL